MISQGTIADASKVDLVVRQDAILSGEDSGAVRAAEIRWLIFMIHKTAMRDLDQRLEDSGTGVSGLQFGVMRMLGQEIGTISELSGRMMLAPATLVPVIDALERKGFVQRGSDPRDRRRIPLVLTDSGAEVMKSVPITGDLDSLAQGLANLGRDKAQQLRALLLELASNLKDDDSFVDRVLALALSEQRRPAA